MAAAWAAAAGLPQLTLADALALCLLVRDREPQRYGRLAVRWLARFCDEQAAVELEEAALRLLELAAMGEARERTLRQHDLRHYVGPDGKLLMSAASSSASSNRSALTSAYAR